MIYILEIFCKDHQDMKLNRNINHQRRNLLNFHSVRRPIFQAKYKFGQHISDKNWNFDEILSKYEVIRWEIVENWLWIIQKEGYWVTEKQKKKW